MDHLSFCVLFFGIASIFVAIIIVLKRQDAISFSYLIFSIPVFLWAVFFFCTITASDAQAALFHTFVHTLFGIIVPVTWVDFCLVLSNQKEKRFVVSGSCFAVSSVLIALLFLSGPSSFIGDVVPTRNFSFYLSPGPLYHAFTAYFFLSVLMGYLLLWRRIRLSKAGPGRKTLLSISISTLPGYIGGCTTFMAVYGIDVMHYSLLLMPWYPLFVAYFMTRDNLFNEVDAVEAAHRDKLVAIGTIASSINHEIRNPLYIIQTIAQSAARQMEGERAHDPEFLCAKLSDSLVRAEKQAQRAMDIMSSFSSFAKKRTETQIKREPLDLERVYQSVSPLVKHELDLREIEVHVQFEAGLPQVMGERTQLEEVFFNLIVNACQAMEEGGKLSIQGKQAESAVLLEFCDTGAGISEEGLKAVFKPFHTTKEAGTGLGLYITKELVERNHGKISVRSEEGKGTSFEIAFPL